MPENAQVKARLAGLFYLVTILAGLFAEIGVRSRLIVDGDDRATAAGIAAHLPLYRAGEAADLVMLICYLAVTGLLYGLLADAERAVARIAALFSLTGIAVLAADGALYLTPLALLSGGGLPDGLRDAAIGRALDLHGEAYGISLVFFGVYCVLIGWLAIRTRRLPWPVGALMALGGASHLALRFAHLLAPGMLPGQLALTALVGESALAFWLLVFGIRTPR